MRLEIDAYKQVLASRGDVDDTCDYIEFDERRNEAAEALADAALLIPSGPSPIDGLTWMGCPLTCPEAWWMHDLLTAVGYPEMAEDLMSAHKYHDTEDDDCKGER